MAAEVATVVLGVAAILVLAEAVLRFAIRLAAHFGLSGGFVGLSILSVGTSIPEIVTHVVGSVAILARPEHMKTLSGMLIGTNVGSDVFQQDFALPFVGLVGVVRVVRSELLREVGALVAASLALWAACAGGWIARWEGVLLAALYVAYLAALARRESETGEIRDAEGFDRGVGVAVAMAAVVAGFGAMAWVAEAVLESSRVLVEALPLSASLFGVVVLGVATALPELATALLSIAKGRQEISAGILIGSNVTNPLLAIGLGAAISGYAVPQVTVVYDLPVKVATALLLLVFLWWHEDLNPWEALALIAVFLAYAGARSVLFPEDFPLAG